MDRREFLKLSGLTSTALVLGACEDYNATLEAYAIRPPDMVPGVPAYFASACEMCPAGCGIMARVIDGRVHKVEGLPGHPVNHGGLCALGQSSVQLEYHPDRFYGPDVRSTRGTPSAAYQALQSTIQAAFASSSRPTKLIDNMKVGVLSFGAPDAKLNDEMWAKAHAQTAAMWPTAISKLAAGLTSGGASTAILVGHQIRGHRYALLAKLAKAFGAPAPLVVEPFGHEAVRAANAAVFGRPEIPTYDLPNAELVIVFGDDLFTSGLAPTHYTWGYGALRRARQMIRGKLVVVGTRFGEAATIADMFVAVKPGTHGAIAQALLPASHGGITPAMAASLTGASEAQIAELANLYKTIRPVIAIGGGEVASHTNAVPALTAIAALNVDAGSVGKVVLPPPPPPLAGIAPPAPASYKDLQALATRMGSGAVKSLLLVGLDPFMAFPSSAKLGAALKNVPFVASFSTLPDDGTAYADVVLPDATFLERWGDTTPSVGVGASVATLMQPAVDPFFDVRSVEDVVLAASKQAGHDLGFPDGESYYKAMWAPIAPDTQVPGTQSPWTKALRVGGVSRVGNGPAYAAHIPAIPVPEAPTFYGDAKARPYHLIPVRSTKYRDGLGTSLPWLQEWGDPMTTGAWGGWIELNPKTAQTLGVDQYDEVKVESDYGSLTLGVALYPGLPENAVGVPLNYSRANGTRYDQEAAGTVWEATQKTDPGRGPDARALLGTQVEARAGGLAWGSTRVSVTPTGRKVPLGKLVLVSKGIQPQENPAMPPVIHQEFKVWPIG